MVESEEKSEEERLFEFLLEMQWKTTDLNKKAVMPVYYNRQTYALFTLIKLAFSKRVKVMGFIRMRTPLYYLAQWAINSVEHRHTDYQVIGDAAHPLLKWVLTRFVARLRRAVEDGRFQPLEDGGARIGFLRLPKWFVAQYTI